MQITLGQQNLTCIVILIQFYFNFSKIMEDHITALQSRTPRLKGFWFWCPCMEINVSVQYNGGLLPDIILSTRCNYIGEPF